MGTCSCMRVKTEMSTECFHCHKTVEKPELVTCVRCNIVMHKHCNQEHSTQNYTECPSCNRTGSLGVMIEHMTS